MFLNFQYERWKIFSLNRLNEIMKNRENRRGLFKKATTYTYLFTYCVCLVHVVHKFALRRVGACMWRPEASGICLNHSPTFVCVSAHMCVSPCVHAKSLSTFPKALILSALGLQLHDSVSPLSPVTRTHPRG